MSVVSIDGSGNGEGLMKVPMMNNIKLGVTLSGIQVAEGGCIVAGKAETSGIDVAVLNDKQRQVLKKAYALYEQVLNVATENAGAIAETITNLKDFIQKAKDFSKNYKGGNTDAKKAKIYEEYAKNAQKVLLNSKNLPATIRADLESKIVATQPAWDFFKTGNKCNGTSAGKGGPNFEDYTNECEAFSAAIIAEMDAMEEAEGSFTCNCSPIISECSPIKDILSQIKEANFSKKESISISKTDNKDKLSNDTDWVSALNGIDIGGKCFKFSLEFKFSGDKIDLNPNSYKETKNGYDLVDEKDNTLLSINILNESGQAKYLKQAVLKEYLGFEELTDDFVPGSISELSPALAPSNGTTNFKGGTYGCTRILSNPTEERIKRFSFRCVDVNDTDNGKYYRFHGGVDISLPFGTTIKAILGGEVVKIQINDDDTDGLGSNVIIKSKLKDGTVIYYHYGHLEGSSINIKNKSKIQKGTEFAKTGNTGNISTIGGIESRTIQQHCHLEVYINGLSKDNRVNPKNHLENSLKKIIENYE
mgnify:CR=1 FL=1